MQNFPFRSTSSSYSYTRSSRSSPSIFRKRYWAHISIQCLHLHVDWGNLLFLALPCFIVYSHDMSWNEELDWKETRRALSLKILLVLSSCFLGFLRYGFFEARGDKRNPKEVAKRKSEIQTYMTHYIKPFLEDRQDLWSRCDGYSSRHTISCNPKLHEAKDAKASVTTNGKRSETAQKPKGEMVDKKERRFVFCISRRFNAIFGILQEWFCPSIPG